MGIQPPLALLPDPPCRPDGGCVICGQPCAREGVPKMYAAAAAGDPFCSTACARAWHGCALPVHDHKGRRPSGFSGHGTVSEYKNRGCRCDDCKAAASRDRKARA